MYQIFVFVRSFHTKMFKLFESTGITVIFAQKIEHQIQKSCARDKVNAAKYQHKKALFYLLSCICMKFCTELCHGSYISNWQLHKLFFFFFFPTWGHRKARKQMRTHTLLSISKKQYVLMDYWGWSDSKHDLEIQ